MGGDDSDCPVAYEQRDVQPGGGADAACGGLVDFGIVDDGIHALAPLALEHLSRLGLLQVDGQARELLGSRSVDCLEAKAPGPVRKSDQNEAGVDELTQAACDQLEQGGQVDLRGEGVPDFVQILELTRPASGRLVQARVLDGDGGLRREQCHELLVLSREVRAALLLGQVEIPESDASQHDRDAEKGVHRGVVRGEADGAGILRDVVQPERCCLPDEHAENPPSSWEIADGSVGLRIDSVGEESLQLRPGWVDHPKRGVTCSGQHAGGLDQLLQDRVERELRGERDARLEQRSQPVLPVVNRHGAYSTVAEWSVAQTGR